MEPIQSHIQHTAYTYKVVALNGAGLGLFGEVVSIGGWASVPGGVVVGGCVPGDTVGGCCSGGEGTGSVVTGKGLEAS